MTIANQWVVVRKKYDNKNAELLGKIKTESPLSNGKINSSNTSNKWKTTVTIQT